MADFVRAAPSHLGWTAERVGGAMCLKASGVAAREINCVFAPVDDPAAVLAHYDGHPHIICGGDDPGHGYTAGYAWMIFTRAADPDAWASTDLVIEQVGPAGGLDFARPVRVAFGMPESVDAVIARLPGRAGWTCLVAYDGDRPVAAGAMYVHGAEAYLTFGATLPEARGRGAQGALMARRIALAAAQGARTVATETGVDGSPSYRNITRAGFTEVGPRPNWDSPTS